MKGTFTPGQPLPDLPANDDPRREMDMVPVLTETASTSRITLEDGAELLVRGVIDGVLRHKVNRDEEGNPAYSVAVRIQTTLVKPPKKKSKLIS